jgi:hypothetical protein
MVEADTQRSATLVCRVAQEWAENDVSALVFEPAQREVRKLPEEIVTRHTQRC